MKVFYHTDNDGFLSAALVANFKPQKADMKYVPINYDKPFPMDDIEEGEEVWILDYHIPPEQMDVLLDRTRNVVWIDHHETAIKKYQAYQMSVEKLPIKGIRDVRLAGCALTWLYILGYTVNQYFAMPKLDEYPKVIDLVDNWDTWGHGSGPNLQAKLFNAGSQIHDTEPTGAFWKECLSVTGNKITTTIQEGAIVTAYKKQHAEEYCKASLCWADLDGYRCAILNIGMAGRDWFESVCANHVDIFVTIVFNGEKWLCTLYSNSPEIHVGEIAKGYGGGGHPGAAGFECETLPFEFGVRK